MTERESLLPVGGPTPCWLLNLVHENPGKWAIRWIPSSLEREMRTGELSLSTNPESYEWRVISRKKSSCRLFLFFCFTHLVPKVQLIISTILFQTQPYPHLWKLTAARTIHLFGCFSVIKEAVASILLSFLDIQKKCMGEEEGGKGIRFKEHCTYSWSCGNEATFYY
jgi:hypothetical protein